MSVLRFFLLLLLLFITLSGVVAGIDLMLEPNGIILRLHTGLLDDFPFSNFFLPGLLSLLFAGGSSFVALLLMWDESRYTLPAALCSGIIVVIWISCVALSVKNISWVGAIYWITGFAVITVSLYIQQKCDDILPSQNTSRRK